MCGAKESRDTPDTDAVYAVGVRSRFLCRSCNRPAPVDHLAITGEVRCVLCGFEQGLNPADWREVVALAHAVGDLHGPSPSGRQPSPVAFDNPFADLGKRKVGVRLQQHGSADLDGFQVSRSLQATLVPGHPRCDRCGATVRIEAGSTTTTTCPNCGNQVHYRAPAEALSDEGAIAGIIADDLRVERAVADGVLADGKRFACASCGAALQADGIRRVVRCAFCGTMNHVSREVRHELLRSPEPDTWWLLFEGPSGKRLDLECDPSRWDSLPAEAHDAVEIVPIVHRLWPSPLRWGLYLGLPGLALLIGSAIVVGFEWLKVSGVLNRSFP